MCSLCIGRLARCAEGWECKMKHFRLQAGRIGQYSGGYSSFSPQQEATFAQLGLVVQKQGHILIIAVLFIYFFCFAWVYGIDFLEVDSLYVHLNFLLSLKQRNLPKPPHPQILLVPSMVSNKCDVLMMLYCLL